MRCWTCSQPVASKHLTYRLPTGALEWVYGCLGCRTIYQVGYARATGPLGTPGLLQVQAVAPTSHRTVLIGDVERDSRDPLAEAEARGDLILRSPT